MSMLTGFLKVLVQKLTSLRFFVTRLYDLSTQKEVCNQNIYATLSCYARIRMLALEFAPKTVINGIDPYIILKGCL